MLFVLAAVATYFAIRQTHIVFSFVLYAFFGLGASLGPAVLYCAIARRHPHRYGADIHPPAI